MLLIIVSLVAAAAAHPTQNTQSFAKRTSYPNGIATFNDYAAQGNTNCGPSSGQAGTYGAAASDISPGISGGTCPGHILMEHCSGQNPVPNYPAPGCPKSNCGKCYKVTNNGGIGGSIGGIGRYITIQIIDACPAASAYNFCKTNMPLNQRCGDSGTNQLDIDVSAYMALTGQVYGGGPNLNVLIEDSDCSGATGAGNPSASSASPAAHAQSSSPSDLSPGLPGQHSAAGDKLAEHQVGGASLNLLEPGSPDGVAKPHALSSSSSSSTANPPTLPATTSTHPPPSSSSSSPANPKGDVAKLQEAQKNTGTLEDDGEECDEL